MLYANGPGWQAYIDSVPGGPNHDAKTILRRLTGVYVEEAPQCVVVFVFSKRAAAYGRIYRGLQAQYFADSFRFISEC